MYTEKTIFKLSTIIPFSFPFVKKNRGSTGCRETRKDHFLRKDMQSVHWSMVGLASWVPTRIRSREQ